MLCTVEDGSLDLIFGRWEGMVMVRILVSGRQGLYIRVEVGLLEI